jgi:hypothetical protein
MRIAGGAVALLDGDFEWPGTTVTIAFSQGSADSSVRLALCCIRMLQRRVDL